MHAKVKALMEQGHEFQIFDNQLYILPANWDRSVGVETKPVDVLAPAGWRGEPVVLADFKSQIILIPVGREEDKVKMRQVILQVPCD